MANIAGRVCRLGAKASLRPDPTRGRAIARLEELTPGARVQGVLPRGAVTVVYGEMLTRSEDPS